MSVLLDTHVWIWWLTPRSALTARERAALDAAAERGPLALAAISMLEAQMLYAKRRLELPMPFAQWLARATDERMLRVLPLDREVVVAVNELPAKFHGAPADRLIAATARAHALPLATRDVRLRRSGLVRVWKP